MAKVKGQNIFEQCLKRDVLTLSSHSSGSKTGFFKQGFRGHCSASLVFAQLIFLMRCGLPCLGQQNKIFLKRHHEISRPCFWWRNWTFLMKILDIFQSSIIGSTKNVGAVYKICTKNTCPLTNNKLNIVFFVLWGKVASVKSIIREFHCRQRQWKVSLLQTVDGHWCSSSIRRVLVHQVVLTFMPHMDKSGLQVRSPPLHTLWNSIQGRFQAARQHHVFTN